MVYWCLVVGDAVLSIFYLLSCSCFDSAQHEENVSMKSSLFFSESLSDQVQAPDIPVEMGVRVHVVDRDDVAIEVAQVDQIVFDRALAAGIVVEGHGAIFDGQVGWQVAALVGNIVDDSFSQVLPKVAVRVV